MADTAHQDPARSLLQTPVQLGALRLPNRVLMAPLTRMRADPARVPQPIVAEYYAQRAGAGLLIAEATSVSQCGAGYPNTPGIYTDAQQAAWQVAADAVHAAGGRIFLQLWHVGRISHSSHQPGGGPPVSSSAVAAKGRIVTADHQQVPLPTPRPLELHEFAGVVAEYADGARRAKAAGFDGVEIHAANGYLLDQFQRDCVNQRTDRYGGSLDNRVRLTLEVVEAVTGIWGAERVGIRLSPSGTTNDMRDCDPYAVFSHLLRALSPYGLAYAHVTQATEEDIKRGSPAIPVAEFRPHFKGPLISAGGFTRASGEQALREGWLDAVVYGQLFISNPDLPQRFAGDAPLTEPDRKTYYTPGPQGYTDYPRWAPLAA